MKTLAYILFIFFSILSCTKENENIAKHVSEHKIKRKLFYENLYDSIPRKILEFQYDNDNNIEKIYHFYRNNIDEYYWYELFKYKDNKPSLKYSYSYNNEVLSWEKYDSTKFSYQDDKLVTEEIIYFTSYFDVILYKYVYLNTNIIEKRKYYNQQFESLTRYEYLGNLCTQESLFSDSLLNNRIEYTVHTFNEKVRTKSEKFLDNGSKIQIITYTYDNEGRLIVEHSQQTDYPVTIQLDYVLRYEYLY